MYNIGKMTKNVKLLSLIGIAAALAGAFVLFLNTNSSTVQAATIQIPTQGTSYVRKVEG